MHYKIVFTEKATQDIAKLKKSGQKQLVDKLTRLILECRESPRTGTGKIEPLKYRSVETWSRRINQEHRLVYEIDEENKECIILSTWGHYI